METTQKTTGRVLYYRNTAGENDLKTKAHSAAKLLNDVYAHFKFKTISEIPSQVHDWMIKRTLETNKELAKMAKTIKLNSLNYEIPDWIRQAGDMFNLFNAAKNQYNGVWKFVKQVDEVFTVDSEALEAEFEKSYRKYLTQPEQLRRLDICKREISVLEDAGMKYPDDFRMYFRVSGHPFVRVRNGKYIPNLQYVTDGTIHPNAPIRVNDDYLTVDL